MTKLERKEKERILDYYYNLRTRVNDAEIVELNKMIKQLEEELGGTNE